MSISEPLKRKFVAYRTAGGGQSAELVRVALDHLTRSEPSLAATVLRDTLRLWGEFFADGSLYQVPAGSHPSEDAHAVDNLLARAGALPAHAEPLIRQVVDAGLADETMYRSLAVQLLALFEETLNEAFDRRHPRDAMIVEERSGVLVDAAEWRHGWGRRRHMLQETADSISYLDEVRELAVAAVKDIATTRDEIALATDELNRVTELLTEARAERAQNELATHFSGLARGERLASNALRVLTGLLLVAAAVAGWRLAGSNGWDGALAHVLVVTAIGGAAAYTARLGTSHRATADWAKSIHVQLDTFKDFLAEVDSPDARNRVYEEFGRRVLGAPPAANGEESAPLPTAQVLELASIIANASRK